MPMNGTFNAQQFAPRQAGDAHPAGKFQAQISNTEIKPTKDNSGGMFVVEFTTPAGTISNRYNLWNSSPKAVEIAQHELSALCYATGIFNIDWSNDGAALRGARCMIDVAAQLNKDGTPSGYMEIKKVLDANGNEPGKAAQQPQAQPQQQQPNPAQQQQQPLQNNNGGGWGAPQQTQLVQQQPQPNAATGQGWGAQPQPQATGQANTPPWGQPR